MVLVVRNDLKMGKGKVAAQVTSHYLITRTLTHSSYLSSALMLLWVHTSR